MTGTLEARGLGLVHDPPEGPRRLVAPLDLALGPGRSLAIVGESGSGKSLTAKALAGLLPPGVRAQGSVRLDGRELPGLPEREWQRLRGRRVSMLLQDPFTMLNPVLRCGAHVEVGAAQDLARAPFHP